MLKRCLLIKPINTFMTVYCSENFRLVDLLKPFKCLFTQPIHSRGVDAQKANAVLFVRASINKCSKYIKRAGTVQLKMIFYKVIINTTVFTPFLTIKESHLCCDLEIPQ
jgi:hypothetical protein